MHKVGPGTWGLHKMISVNTPGGRGVQAGTAADSTWDKTQLYRRIVVAIDGSPCSEKALNEAVRIAKCEGASLTVLHVMVVPSALFSPNVRQPIERVELDERARGERLLAAAAAKAKESGVEPRRALIEGMDSAINGIADYAAKNKFDLVVVGTRGLTGIKRLLIGSVAAGVVRCSPCTVMVVK